MYANSLYVWCECVCVVNYLEHQVLLPEERWYINLQMKNIHCTMYHNTAKC